jgi:XTP/dITP diphosphohydrolase
MGFPFEGRVIFFATNNINKFNEARQVLGNYKIAVGMLRAKTLEVQSDSLEEIAERSATDAFRKCKLPIIVEDAGLFVEELNEFPGPYASYVYRTIGNGGLLKLMKNIKKREAVFKSVVAYKSHGTSRPTCFLGEVVGEITEEERRGNCSSGFGFDPIFRPASSKRTFAEMKLAEKNMCSHRALALRRFADWYREPEQK